MSDPLHVSMARSLLDTRLADPNGPAMLRDAREGLIEGRWGDDYIDALGQDGRHGRESWPLEQVEAFAILHSMVYGGRVASIRIGTGAKPLRDREREVNAAALSRLPRPFTAYVDTDQSNWPGDGVLEWDEPIHVSLATGLIERAPDGSTFPIPLHGMIPAGSAPLEIGSSLASRTLTHLTVDGSAVARWPYGHSLIWLFVNFDLLRAQEQWMEEMQPGKARHAKGSAVCPQCGQLSRIPPGGPPLPDA